MAKHHLNVLIGLGGLAWIDEVRTSVFATLDLTRTDVVRAALAVARKHEREVREVLRDTHL